LPRLCSTFFLIIKDFYALGVNPNSVINDI
jgi:hypothetical protein